MPLPNRVKFLFAGPFMELVAETPQRVIEVSAGTGYTARLIARAHHEAEIVALDLSPEMLAAGRRRARVAELPQISFVLGDVARLPFEADNFDLAIAAFALHELSAEDRAAAIHEIRRVLRPGSALLVADLDNPVVVPALFHAYVRLSHGTRAHGVLGVQLADQIERAGFDITLHQSGLGRLVPFQLIRAVAPTG